MNTRNYSVTQAAEFMGVKERFIRRLIAERRIPFIKLGKHVRISESDILNFEASGRVDASAMPEGSKRGA